VFAMSFGSGRRSFGSTTELQAIKVGLFGGVKNALRTPPQFVSPKDGVVMNTSTLRPLSNGQRYAIMHDTNIAKPIVRLLFSGRPATVVRAIRAIVVNAFKGHILRSRFHVSDKVVKHEPPITNSDASTTIAGVMSRIGVKASSFDCLPAHINWAARFPMSFIHGATVLHWRGKIK
jgi:hypothetical protein